MASRLTSKFQTAITFLFLKILMWFQHCFAWNLEYFNKCIFDLIARMTFSRSKVWPQILTSKKNMEANVYLLQFFWGYSLLFLEYIQKVWRLCFALFLRYNFLKFCFPRSKTIKLPTCLVVSFFLKQGCGSGSGSVLDPYSIGSVDPDPDPYSESGSGSRRAKMTHKSRQ